jgi:hypothetical protein
MQFVGKTPNIPGVFDVAIHGGRNGEFYSSVYGQKLQVSVEEVAESLQRAGWKPGQPVRLFSCWSGSSGAADGLSDYLSTRFGVSTSVRGPLLKVGVDSAGWVEQGVSGPDGSWMPKRSAWKNFSPDAPPQHIPGTAGQILMPDGSYR